jgi:uncharacterized repeat protein (TIGR01451 family)
MTAGQGMTFALLGFGLIVSGLSWAETPRAQRHRDLAISLTASKVIAQPDGKETLQSAERAFPGEVIQYDAHYRNESAKTIRDLAPTLPIPNGMSYVPDSAKPAPVKASLDGKTFEDIPLKRKVTLPNGEVEEREVPASEYRALRWFVGEVEAGGSTTVMARAKLLPTTP